MSNVISNKVYESIQPWNVQPETTGKILYANKFANTDAVAMPEEIRELLDSDVGLNGTNLLIQLENKFKFFRGGPWYIDSRDGVIYIHNRKFQEEIVHTYTYQNENGEVLKVQFQTNYITKSTKVVLHETIDPSTKRTEVNRSELDDSLDLLMKPLDASIDNTMWSNPYTSDHFEDHADHPSNASGAQAYAEATGMKKELEMKRKRDKETRSKVAEDPTYDIRRSQQNILDRKSSKDLENIINTTLNDPNTPMSIRNQMRILVNDVDLAKDPEAYMAKLNQILRGVYYEEPDWHIEEVVIDPLEYSDSPDMDTTTDSGFDKFMGWGNDGNLAKARQIGYQRMCNDPNITVVGVDEWTEGGKVNAGPGATFGLGMQTESGPAPSKVRVIKRTNKPVKVPLTQVYTNLHGRFGGSKRYLWAMNANKNGGLKSKEKEVKVLMTVVGRPQLTTSMVINIQNIGKRWSGPYYVKKCTHTMNVSGGYLCELELIKNSARGGASTSAIRLSSQNVLHVYTDANGKTIYGKKPEEDQASKFMDSFNRDEIAYYTEKSVTASHNGMSPMDAAAFKMAYNEQNADDPYALAAGTVRSDSIVADSKGVNYVAPYKQVDNVSPSKIRGYRSKLPDPKELSQKQYDAVSKKFRLSLKDAQDVAKQQAKTMTEEQLKNVEQAMRDQVGL